MPLNPDDPNDAAELAAQAASHPERPNWENNNDYPADGRGRLYFNNHEVEAPPAVNPGAAEEVLYPRVMRFEPYQPLDGQVLTVPALEAQPAGGDVFGFDAYNHIAVEDLREDDRPISTDDRDLKVNLLAIAVKEVKNTSCDALAYAQAYYDWVTA